MINTCIFSDLPYTPHLSFTTTLYVGLEHSPVLCFLFQGLNVNLPSIFYASITWNIICVDITFTVSSLMELMKHGVSPWGRFFQAFIKHVARQKKSIQTRSSLWNFRATWNKQPHQIQLVSIPNCNLAKQSQALLWSAHSTTFSCVCQRCLICLCRVSCYLPCVCWIVISSVWTGGPGCLAGWVGCDGLRGVWKNNTLLNWEHMQ